MKLNRIFCALFLCMTLLLSVFAMASCGGSDGQSEETRDPNKPAATLDSIYAAVTAVVPNADKLTDAQESQLGSFFNGAKPEDFASYKRVLQSMSTSIDEIGIFEAKSADDVKKIEAMIDDFFEFYLSLWNDDYLAEEKPKLENAERVTSGNFVMYVILDDDARAAAITAFENETK
ncbi:MAG: DUF4358 domain-containing protein [Clostridia bacterium]|nr:DUF4358 domain-containing protein [Clostridia bacterium]